MGLDILTLGAAKQYTNLSLAGIGAIQGSPCTIKEIKQVGNDNIVIFEWTTKAGNTKTSTMSVANGINGKDGVYLESMYVTPENKVIATLSNGKTINAGTITVQGKFSYNDLLDAPSIPIALSQLTNDVNFINSTVDNLENYYKKADSYSKDEISVLLGDLNRLAVVIVDELPNTNISASTFYLVPAGNSSYEQHMYIDGRWADLGSTNIDLKGYVTVAEFNTTLENKANLNHTHEDLHSHKNKTALDKLTDKKIQEWDNNKFSGDYNDLTNVPIIPTVTNDLTDDLKSSYDNAVSKTHSHENQSIIDKFSEDPFGELLYDGKELQGSISSSKDLHYLYAPLSISQTPSVLNEKISLDAAKANGNLSIVDDCIILPPGVYNLQINFRIKETYSSYSIDMGFYNENKQILFGPYCSRYSMNADSSWSNSDCNFIQKFDQETKISTRLLSGTHSANIVNAYITVIEVGKSVMTGSKGESSSTSEDLKYSHVSITNTIVPAKDTKFSLDAASSVSNLKIEDDCVILPPGVYSFEMNFRLKDAATTATYFDARFYNETKQEYFGVFYSKYAINSVSNWSDSDAVFIHKFDEETKVCVKYASTLAGTQLVNCYINIIEIGRQKVIGINNTQLNYASFSIDKSKSVDSNQIVYFNTVEGTLQKTDNNTMIVPAGTYRMAMDIRWLNTDNANKTQTFGANFFDITTQQIFGESLMKLSTNFNTASTNKECDFIYTFNKDTEICIKTSLLNSAPIKFEYFNGNIIEIGRAAVIEKSGGSADITISAEPDNAIIQKDDGIWVEDVSNDVRDMRTTINKLAAKKLTDVLQDYMFMNSTNGVAATATVGLNILSLLEVAVGTLTVTSDKYVRLLKGKTYVVRGGLLGSGGNISYYIVDKFDNKYGTSGHINSGGTTFSDNNCQMVFTNLENDLEICIKVTETTTSSATILPANSWFIVEEIGTKVEIDPVNYVNENYGIEDTPVGHILSHIGMTAPKHYLVCDGGTYNILDYSHLANHIKDAFGSYNHFGGDGATTFAVPDLRNEFLRGYHGEFTEQLSGEIGKHQDATRTPYLQLCSDSGANIAYPGANKPSTNIYPTNIDTSSEKITKCRYIGTTGGTNNCGDNIDGVGLQYTARPTNVAVLYCIKYEPTYFYANIQGDISGGDNTPSYTDEEIAEGIDAIFNPTLKKEAN